MKWIGMGVLGWVLCGISGTSAHAHHALEYIETDSYTTPRKGEKVISLRYDYMVEDKDDPSLDHWEFTPGISYGITDRLMFDAHTHYARFGVGHLGEDVAPQFETRDPSPFFEAAAFTLQYRVTEGGWIDVAVAASIEVPFERARDWLDSSEVYEGTLILSKPFGAHGNVTLNLSYAVEGSEDTSEFALAVKTPISDDPHGIAAGLEWLGDLEDFSGGWSIMPGVYIPLAGSATILKVGAAIGKHADSTKITVALMVPF